ncbi:1055_t:CDS:1, partial [Gigaspora rosea]
DDLPHCSSDLKSRFYVCYEESKRSNTARLDVVSGLTKSL